MENILNFISIIIIVFGILQIILFFKLWGMTNDVKELKELYADRSKELSDRFSDIIKSISKGEVQPTENNLNPNKKLDIVKEDISDTSKNELPVIDEKNNDFKQHLFLKE